MYTEITKCRICGNTKLLPVLDLGRQFLTGVFPGTREEEVTSGPLEIVRCAEGEGEACGLVQLRHSYDRDELYGDTYGYRSGINASMVDHLRARVAKILERVRLHAGDLVIDIGSNDGTLLGMYPSKGPVLAGVDPTAKKFGKYYPPHVRRISGFFSAGLIREQFGASRAKVVTSIAMLYDLESPIDFMRQVREVLADDGIWVFEQSYLPSMLEMNAYDTVCQEHLEYYRLAQIRWMAGRAGFKIIDVELNAVNGGSFAVTVCKAAARLPENTAAIDAVFDEEQRRRLDQMAPYEKFKRNVFRHREELTSLVRGLRARGKKVFGYGASTKGNVILQFCGLAREDITCIAEANADKFGRVTPGTGIPIIPEDEARALKPDYFLVLPWHFRDYFLVKERAYLERGGKIIFPLPSPEVYPRAGP